MKKNRSALILSALPVEYQAVQSHLKNIKSDVHSKGTVYEYGEFEDDTGTVWNVSIAQVGQGNPRAALETERAIAHFKPAIVLFVGVAGSVFICFTFFVLQQVGLALGTGGYLPAWLAAWLPNLAFGVTGLVLAARVR